MPTRQEPETTNVRTLKPQGRENYRRHCREHVEKERLKKRSFGFRRYGSEIDNVLEISGNTPQFCAESERFNVDSHAVLERKRHDLRVAQKEKVYAEKRALNVKREQERGNFEQTLFEAEETRVENLNAPRNQPSMPYDIISLQYNNSLDGIRLHYNDKKTIYRSKLRAKNLDGRSNSLYNPITGAPRHIVETGAEPKVPEALEKSGILY